MPLPGPESSATALSARSVDLRSSVCVAPGGRLSAQCMALLLLWAVAWAAAGCGTVG